MSQLSILITGASDGLGRELARFYRAQGARVLTVGRRAATELEPPERADYCRADLAQPYAAALVTTFLRQRGVDRLDLLIHNAGIGSYGPLAAEPAATTVALLETNLRAPIALTHALLPLLRAARGKLVFIGSVAAALPVPDYAVYGASKAALAAFARSLRVELRGAVRVQVIHPGAIRTGMHAKIGAPLARIGHQRFPPPARVAAQIAAAVAGDAPVVTIGLGNRLLRLAGVWLGGALDAAAARRVAP